MNLENLGVQEINAQEVKNIEGGFGTWGNVQSDYYALDTAGSFCMGLVMGIFY